MKTRHEQRNSLRLTNEQMIKQLAEMQPFLEKSTMGSINSSEGDDISASSDEYVPTVIHRDEDNYKRLLNPDLGSATGRENTRLMVRDKSHTALSERKKENTPVAVTEARPNVDQSAEVSNEPQSQPISVVAKEE